MKGGNENNFVGRIFLLERYSLTKYNKENEYHGDDVWPSLR